MADSRKYAGLLPDLDEDRDLFETPELTDDTSTRPTDSVDEDEDDTDTHSISGISRRRLDADSARSHFYTSKVDARRTDFSDRVDGKRQSYHVTSRRKAGTAEDDLDEEDLSPRDGLKRKIASLLREAEELKAEAQRQQESASQEDDQPDTQSLSQLSSAISILETLGPSAGSIGAEARLAKQLSEASRPTNGDATPSEQTKRSAPSYTLSYQPSFDDQHALSLAASFDTRLKELETALGLTSIPLPTQNDSSPKPLLPTLSTLEKQIELLSATTPASLDTMSKRIRHLTDEAERLNEKRKAAKQSYTEMRAAADATSTTRPKSNSSGAGGAMSSAPPSLLDDSEMEAKIGALYNTLPTIESLAPTLPAVLERLKSLRLLHADAADAATRVEQVEAQGREMSEEVALWRQGLEKMEKAVDEAEKSTKSNMATVEKWVQELEGRVKGLKTGK